MTRLGTQQPGKTYRGTVDEVFNHRNEIPPGAVLELKVFEETPENEDIGDFGGRSVLEAFPDLFGTEHGGPPDMSDQREKYMQDFGETRKSRTL